MNNNSCFSNFTSLRRPAAVIALATTVTACVILIVLIAEEIADAETVSHPAPSVKSFFLSYGTILFAFGGAASFPTFQNDMKDRTQFPKAATFGFLTLLVLYLPVAVLGYLVYGNNLVPMYWMPCHIPFLNQ
ncbi:aa_trans domain-containing protein [Caerostris extrusa]|uniref:Aa_trans domain-containing protein n=1 Tax=Caerostris extrusa TaxID=172846 RepID=A0AAV4TIX8_CAEEX|nr:aa_trans domain-containing protein [Caerostris extrusa]